MPTASAERLIIKTRAELLRTIKREGLVIRVLRHWQPNLANSTRTVHKAQTNGYFFYGDDRNGKRVRMWADIPAASNILFGADGEVTFHPGEDNSWTLAFEFPSTLYTPPESHSDTDEHRAGCTHCQYVHDSKQPDTMSAVMGELAQQGLKPREHSPNPAECVRLCEALAAFWGDGVCDAPIWPGAYLTEEDTPIRDLVRAAVGWRKP